MHVSSYCPQWSSPRKQVEIYFLGCWIQAQRGSLKFTAEAAVQLWTFTCLPLIFPHQMQPDGRMRSICSVLLPVCSFQIIYFILLASLSESTIVTCTKVFGRYKIQENKLAKMLIFLLATVTCYFIKTKLYANKLLWYTPTWHQELNMRERPLLCHLALWM